MWSTVLCLLKSRVLLSVTTAHHAALAASTTSAQSGWIFGGHGRHWASRPARWLSCVPGRAEGATRFGNTWAGTHTTGEGLVEGFPPPGAAPTIDPAPSSFRPPLLRAWVYEDAAQHARHPQGLLQTPFDSPADPPPPPSDGRRCTTTSWWRRLQRRSAELHTVVRRLWSWTIGAVDWAVPTATASAHHVKAKRGSLHVLRYIDVGLTSIWWGIRTGESSPGGRTP